MGWLGTLTGVIADATIAQVISWSAPVLFALSGCVVLFVGVRRLRGSTMIGPWAWAIAAFAGATAGSAFIAHMAGSSTAGGTSNGQTLSFVLATLFFCPAVSVLGAKRPQHNAWHFIVASLWFVLILPAAESALLRPGGALQLHDARAWFLWALIVVTFLNYVFTRYALCAAFGCAGLVVWLSPNLPGLRWQSEYRLQWASLLLTIAVATYFFVRGRTPPVQYELDRDWHEFRDTFGVTWGLRVMERVNTAASQSEWPARLDWDGFKVAEDINDAQRTALKASFVGILRRFNAVER